MNHKQNLSWTMTDILEAKEKYNGRFELEDIVVKWNFTNEPTIELMRG